MLGLIEANTFALFLQGALIGVDEIRFHRRRHLPRWELIGHPVDTLSLIAFLAALRFTMPHEGAPQVWILALALISCLMITKDEWVHKQHAPGSENWLHALLFVLHPIVLALFWMGWKERVQGIETLLSASLAAAGGFLFYQIFEGVRRWNK